MSRLYALLYLSLSTRKSFLFVLGDHHRPRLSNHPLINCLSDLSKLDRTIARKAFDTPIESRFLICYNQLNHLSPLFPTSCEINSSSNLRPL